MPIHTADMTQLSSRVGGVYWIRNEFTTSLIEKLKTEHVENLSTVSSRVGCRIENWVTTADTIHRPTQLNSTQQSCSVVNFYTKSVGSRRKRVANSIQYTPRDADATQLDSWVASAVCTVLGFNGTTFMLAIQSVLVHRYMPQSNITNKRTAPTMTWHAAVSTIPG